MPRAARSLNPIGRRADSRRRLLLTRTAADPADSVDAQSSRRLAAAPSRLAEGRSEASAGMAAVAHLLRGVQPVSWVFTGDSITHGALYTEGWRSFVELFSERVRWELRRFHDVVINTGVCGERAGGLLASLEQRVSRFRADVTLILIGMNDALAGPAGRGEFRRDLTELCERLRETGTIPVLQTPNRVYEPHCHSRRDLPAYVDIIRETADRVEVPLIDHWQHWQARGTDAESLLGWLHDQALHPNYLGHREMCRLICQSFAIYDSASLTCSLAVTAG